MGHRTNLHTAALVALLLLAPLLTHAASAQERPFPSLDLSAGWVGFADDGIVSEGMVGGAGRFYLSPRLAIGPELLYIGGDHHSREGAFTAGGGVRAAVGQRVTVGVDARLGWETHVRINGVVGVRLRR